MGICIWILYAIWEFPQAILAGIIAACIHKMITGWEYYNNTKIIYVKGFPGGISLGRLIFLNNRYSESNISKKHEYGHSVQSILLGWAYLPLIGLPSILRVLIWRIRKLDWKDYYLGYPENWANRLGFGKKEYCKKRKY